MKDPIPVLLVGCLAAFGLGFALGQSRCPPAEPRTPINYSPEQAVCEAAIKSAQSGQERCWTLFLQQERAKVGH